MVSVVVLDIVYFFLCLYFAWWERAFLERRPLLVAQLISRVERLLFAPVRSSDQILP